MEQIKLPKKQLKALSEISSLDLEIIQGISDGLSYTEAGMKPKVKKLNENRSVSQRGVDNRIGRIKDKTGAKTPPHLVKLCLAAGVINF
jgi:hypothetical protein